MSFICETCHDNWYGGGDHFSGSYGRCENCGKSAPCFDCKCRRAEIPSYFLNDDTTIMHDVNGNYIPIIYHYDSSGQRLKDSKGNYYVSYPSGEYYIDPKTGAKVTKPSNKKGLLQPRTGKVKWL